ncbi:MAG: 50S ribosomal protein L29 [Gammaproteobacteria bacterium]|nr:50S ribosomal protein L29 [Gammaproteobacteria bacterium]
MKAEELRKKNSNELQGELQELLKEQFKLRMQKGSGQMSNPARIKAVRRDIARIKTIMNEMGNKA